MSDAERPPEVGQHLLGPHVVGQRIVVRRLVRGETGPTGGPAFTDLLGTCVAWGGAECVVQPESGAAVTIALADIVSGKPVPPRPAVRHRVTVAEAEARVATLWPGVRAESLGGWTLRHAPAGPSAKRANSCLAVAEPGMAVPEALDRVAASYAERGRRPLVHVAAGSDVERAVAAAGWSPVPGDADFLLASISRVRRSLPTTSDAIELAASGPRAVASAGTGCDPLAEGRVTVDGDWAGLHALSVDAAHRRRGLGTGVVAELLEWAAEQGALTAWLHVETDNPAALAFWEALGFTVHHRMRYYAPQP